jgi:large repetitive protein
MNLDGVNETGTTAPITYIPSPIVTALASATGPTAGGTTVSITGANLNGAYAVYFGTTAAGILTDNASQITAISPTGIVGAVDVTVLTSAGISAPSLADHFTYFQGAPGVTGISPNAGPTGGGTTLTISGTNLGNAKAVDFGATAVTNFVSNSATRIVAVSPPGTAGAVDVRVVAGGSTSAIVAGDTFTYQAPAITGVSPNGGPTGGGTTLTITGTNLGNAKAVDFGTTAVTSFVSSSATRIVVVSPTGTAGTVDVCVVAGGSNSAIVAADKFTYQAPTITGVSPNAGPTGGGTTVTITGTNLGNAKAVDFGTTAVTSFISSSATRIVLVSPKGAAVTVDVRVVAGGSTSAIVAADKFAYKLPLIAKGIDATQDKFLKLTN